MTTWKPRLIATRVGPVEAAVAGSGPAVLLVHGFPGDWTQGRALGERLLPGRTVVLVSRPGYGRTPLATGRGPRAQAAAYAGVLDTLEAGGAAVVGISGGGPSAHAFAAEERDRCTALVLLCALAAHELEVPRGLAVLSRIPRVWGGLARVAARREAALGEDEQLRRAAALLGPAEQGALADPRVRAEVLDFQASRLRAMTDTHGMAADVAAWRAARRQPAPAWPDGPPVPTLVLHGELDEVVPVSHAHAYAAAVPGATLEVLPGVRHAFPLSLADTVATRVARHLEAV